MYSYVFGFSQHNVSLPFNCSFGRLTLISLGKCFVRENKISKSKGRLHV